MGVDIKGLGVSLCVKYVLPKIKEIVKSAISKLAKSIYEKLYDKFKHALESFENALTKLSQTQDLEKLEKGLKCCCLGLCFFEKIFKVLGDLLPKYFEKIEELKQTYKELGGREL